MLIRNTFYFIFSLALSLVTSQASKTHKDSQATTQKTPIHPEIKDIILGSKNSPIKLVEYSSINCGHCAHFHQEILQTLKTKYIKPRKLQMIFKHFPLDYPAVEYMSLIAKQPYNQWLDLLEIAYAHQKEWRGQPPEKLAAILGISEKDCKAARACAQTKELIMAKRFNAEQVLDIQATPTFQIFYKVRGVEKKLLLNQGTTPSTLLKKLDEILKVADKV